MVHSLSRDSCIFRQLQQHLCIPCAFEVWDTNGYLMVTGQSPVSLYRVCRARDGQHSGHNTIESGYLFFV